MEAIRRDGTVSFSVFFLPNRNTLIPTKHKKISKVFKGEDILGNTRKVTSMQEGRT